MRRLALVLVVLAACVDAAGDDDTDPGGGKADGNGTCTDPLYADGTCQLDLDCGMPDLDCFVVFPTDADAASWVTARWNKPLVAETDPVFPRARMLMDRAWAAFVAEVPLGKLAEQRMGVVVMDDPTINAYVLADGAPGMTGLTVLVHRGTLESAMTDDEIIGLLLHEIAHAARQHVIDEVASKLVRFYIGGTPEPLGHIQPEEANARRFGMSWQATGYAAGVVTDPALGDFPVDGNLGVVFDTYVDGLPARVPACAAAVTRVQNARRPSFSLIEVSYSFTPAQAHEAVTALDALRSCVATDEQTLQDLLVVLGPGWVTYIADALEPSEQPLLLSGTLDAILGLTAHRRSQMRATEAAFTTATGKPWSAVRYFSTEEEADDYSARITRAQTIADVGVSGFMFAVLDGERPACEQFLDGGGPVPYGKNLNDSHHGVCWRIAHARQVAGSSTTAARIAGAIAAPRSPWTPTRRQTPRPLY